MGEHGASFDGPSIYDGESENGGSGVIKIAVVAALGGFLFGYDSSVINGANQAITAEFNPSPLELGSPSRPPCSAPRPAPSWPAGWPTRWAASR